MFFALFFFKQNIFSEVLRACNCNTFEKLKIELKQTLNIEGHSMMSTSGLKPSSPQKKKVFFSKYICFPLHHRNYYLYHCRYQITLIMCVLCFPQQTMQRIVQRYIFDIQREAEVTEGSRFLQFLYLQCNFKQI